MYKIDIVVWKGFIYLYVYSLCLVWYFSLSLSFSLLFEISRFGHFGHYCILLLLLLSIDAQTHKL
jgi:hypothetical protein